tara:strand:- start:863 stop:2515 length:1653 start_codon:yes stop_codon:yes gene_type:complete
MGLEKLIVGQMTGAAASAFKMDIRLAELREKAIDKIASNIEDQIPIPLPFDTREALNGNPLPPNLLTPEILSQAQEIPESTKQPIRDTLDKIEEQLNSTITTKNQLQGSLNTLTKPLETLDKLATTLGTVLPALKGVITLLKALPVPSAVPPGVGVPLNVINGMSDTLDTIKKVIDKIDGPISVIAPSISSITKIIVPLVGKLALIDTPVAQATQIVIFIRTLLDFGPFATQQQINDVAVATTAGLVESLAASPGPIISNSDADANKEADAALLALLSPPFNKESQYMYKGYRLEIQYDPNNKFPFPSRRIKGSYTLTLSDFNANDTSTNFKLRLIGSEVYNLIDDGYSFSSSVQVLISEIKYQIDRFIDGKKVIQNQINSEYIVDQNGVPIGRIPGRPGVSIPGVGQQAIRIVQSSATSQLPTGNYSDILRVTPQVIIFDTYIALYPFRGYKPNISVSTPALTPRTTSGFDSGSGTGRGTTSTETSPPPTIPSPNFPFTTPGTPGEIKIYEVPNSTPKIYKTYKWELTNNSKFLTYSWKLISTVTSNTR